ncbi:MAG TPA: condensation domain-containing protein, partial [Streptosporangiaceae bacterium]
MPMGAALPAQHGTILNYMRFPDDGVDVIQVTLDWTSPLEREPFEAAWHAAARRHPVLRTAFRLDADGLVQVVDPDASMDIRWRDLPPPPLGVGPDHPFEAFLREDRRERFDLARGPLVRLTIVRRIASGASASGASASDSPASGSPASGSPAHRAVLTFHHALLDGQSLRLLVDEISAAYAAGRDGRATAGGPGLSGATADPPSSKFHEYVRWWHTTDTSTSEQFWSSYLAGTVLPRPLPGYLGAPAAGVAEPMTAETVLSREDSNLIRSNTGLSSSTMVTAAWALLRARYGGVTDVVVAVTRSCRRDSIPGAETIVGPLINTVPLRVRLDDEWPVRELLTTANDSIHRIRQHQRTPMGSALSWAGFPADTALVDSLVMFDRRRLTSGLPGGDAAPSAARVDRLPSFPLTVLAFDEPRIHLSLIWDRRRFADGSAQRILGQLRATLIEFASSLSTPLADLDLGRAAESEMLAEWNRTRAGYPADATIPALFAAQVARDPEATALVSSTGAMSYGELDRRSNALALLLRRRGVVRDMPVGVAMPRGTDLIVALLAVLKAGGAYLPIDAGSPPSRVAAMLAAADARLVLVTPDTAPTLSQLANVDLIRVDQEPTPPTHGSPAASASELRRSPGRGGASGPS